MKDKHGNRTRLVLAALSAALATGAANGNRHDDRAGPDYQALADKQAWEWEDERARLIYSMEHYPGFYDVRLERSAYSSVMQLRFVVSPWSERAFHAHRYTTFTGSGDVVYVADFDANSAGCALRARDLRQRRSLWESCLAASGQERTVACPNRVRLELYEDVLMVWGKEGDRGYLEIVDRSTGKTVGRKVFGDTTQPAAVGSSPRPERLHEVLYWPLNQHGKWSYQQVITNAHSRSRRSQGLLKYDGNEIAGGDGKRIWTPWGQMGFVSGPFRRGWWAVGSMTIPEGPDVPSPDQATSRLVRQRREALEKGLATLALTVEFPPASPGGLSAVRLHVADEAGAPRADSVAGRISPSAGKWILQRLTVDGLLARASDDPSAIKKPPGPNCVFHLTWREEGKTRHLVEHAGFDFDVCDRLDCLRSELRFEESAPLDFLLGRLTSQIRVWQQQRAQGGSRPSSAEAR